MRWIVLFILALSLPASAEVSNSICRATGNEICSKTFYGEGKCTGLDQLPIFEEPWEARPMRITGVSVTVIMTGKPRWRDRIRGVTPRFFSFAGNSSSPDVMTKLYGPGSTPSPHYPNGQYFSFPGKTGKLDPHVDLHVQCVPIGLDYISFLTIFYQFDQTRMPAHQ